jgi:hypothetical protein
VTDGSNNPLSGVSVSAGAGGSATTNASGYYTITNVVTGAYTVTPFKSGYTFSPSSRSVSVPPSRTGVNFTGSTAPIPSQAYSTYIGGSGGEMGYGIAVDSGGNAYVTGFTASTTDFPTTTGVLSPTLAGGAADAFVVKLNAAGTALVYATYLGGSGDTDVGYGIAVDGSGNAYVTGQTSSEDWPVTAGALASAFRGGSFDAFMVKVNADGSALLYGSYLGGANNESGQGIALGDGGKVYVAGWTDSDNFPTTGGAYDTSHNGGDDAFLVKLSLVGSGAGDLVYGTYLGSSANEEAKGLAVDVAGRAYLVGTVWGDAFPTTAGVFQPTAPGNLDIFVSRLNPAGGGTADLVYSSYLGSGGVEDGLGIAVDASGNAYVTGSGRPTPDYTDPPGALAVKINATGSALVYARTLYGTDGPEFGRGIAVDSAGNAYVTGSTCSSDFPVTAGALIG